MYTPRGLATALCLQVPHRPRHTVVCVYSKFTPRDKAEVDQFIHSMTLYNILWKNLNMTWHNITPASFAMASHTN